MENYLYFRKNRPVSASVTLGSVTQICPAFSAADIGAVANNDNINEIAAISIKSAGGGGTPNASVLYVPTAITPTLSYVGGAALPLAIGSTHWIAPADQLYANGILTLDAGTTTGGYTLAVGDIVTAYWKTGLETAFMYPVSALKGIIALSDISTSLHFASIYGNGQDDVLTFTHGATQFEAFCKMINNACNGYPKEGKMIKVYDGHDGIVSHLNKDSSLAITLMEYVPDVSAGGMAS